ncbi:putative dynein light chain [Nymphaea thermarum]|nr:putative dynein light chain [Nymphaea thermarum]
MLEGKALVQDTDMPAKMQVQAMTSASRALDLYDEFDAIYGCGWQCVVGYNFGCFFTHSEGTFIYFCVETLNFLVFKGAPK